jgi:GT2 family glycosyltransferase
MNKLSLILFLRQPEFWLDGHLRALAELEKPAESLELMIVSSKETGQLAERLKKAAGQKFELKFISSSPNEVSALNDAIKKSTGEIVFFLNENIVYPANYLVKMLGIMEQESADKIAGKWISIPAGNQLFAQSIAEVLKSGFVVGNTPFKIQTTKITQTHFLSYGCVKREALEKYGLFDERLLMNFDYEWTLRAIRGGAKTLFIPDIKLDYTAPSSLGKLIQYFYQSAFNKPLENKISGSKPTLAQLIPVILFIFFGLTGILSLFSQPALLFFATGLMVYFFKVTWEAFGVSVSSDKSRHIITSIFFFPLIHFAYALGYILGYFSPIIRQQK